MSDILPYLGVERTYDEGDVASKTVILEDYSAMTRTEAEKLLKKSGITAKFVGDGDCVTAQLPQAGKSVSGGSEILLYMGQEAEETWIEMPDFSGMNRSEAAQTALSLGIYILVSGNTQQDANVIAAEQSIAPGTQVTAGTCVSVRFADMNARD